MNIENLKALREFERGREIDMNSYMNDCGTAGCHAGWEVWRIGAGLAGLKLRVGFGVWHTAKESLGLTDFEAAFLFMAFSHSGVQSCGRREAEARLDYLIEHGRAPDNWLAWAEQIAAEGAANA